MSQEKIILCQSTRVMSRPTTMSQMGTCAECSIGVWLAPSSINVMKNVPDVRVLCESCAMEFIGKSTEPVAVALAPGAMQEAMAELRKVGNN